MRERRLQQPWRQPQREPTPEEEVMTRQPIKPTQLGRPMCVNLCQPVSHVWHSFAAYMALMPPPRRYAIAIIVIVVVSNIATGRRGRRGGGEEGRREGGKEGGCWIPLFPPCYYRCFCGIIASLRLYQYNRINVRLHCSSSFLRKRRLLFPPQSVVITICRSELPRRLPRASSTGTGP
eukprot:GHVU01105791.1.p1 GENE.GHVU01105791.1~~GHVU01105791.1.p1  ORF type:complete len:178 (-),score=19.78 GHVU01105791.1:177-710(-)